MKLEEFVEWVNKAYPELKFSKRTVSHYVAMKVFPSPERKQNETGYGAPGIYGIKHIVAVEVLALLLRSGMTKKKAFEILLTDNPKEHPVVRFFENYS